MTLLPIQQYAHRKEQTIDKHIACGVAEHHVESLTFIYTHHLAVSSIMRYEIKERKQNAQMCPSSKNATPKTNAIMPEQR